MWIRCWMNCVVQLLPFMLLPANTQWAFWICVILVDTLPCKNSTQPISSWLSATSLIAVDITPRLAIDSCPRCRRYSLIQKASSGSVLLWVLIHWWRFHTPFWNSLDLPGSGHLFGWVLSSLLRLQLGHLSSIISWMQAVFLWVAQTLMACFDRHSWKPSGLFLIACSSAFQSTDSNLVSGHMSPPLLLPATFQIARV